MGRLHAYLLETKPMNSCNRNSLSPRKSSGFRRKQPFQDQISRSETIEPYVLDENPRRKTPNHISLDNISRYKIDTLKSSEETGENIRRNPKRRHSWPSLIPRPNRHSSDDDSTPEGLPELYTASSVCSSLIVEPGGEPTDDELQAPDDASVNSSPPSYEDAMSTPSPTLTMTSTTSSDAERSDVCYSRPVPPYSAYLPIVEYVKRIRSFREHHVSIRRVNMHAS